MQDKIVEIRREDYPNLDGFIEFMKTHHGFIQLMDQDLCDLLNRWNSEPDSFRFISSMFRRPQGEGIYFEVFYYPLVEGGILKFLPWTNEVADRYGFVGRISFPECADLDEITRSLKYWEFWISHWLSREIYDYQIWENSEMIASKGGFLSPHDALLDLAETAPINSDQVKFWF